MKDCAAAMGLPVRGNGGFPGVHEAADKPRPLEAGVGDVALSAVAAAACALFAAVCNKDGLELKVGLVGHEAQWPCQ